MKNFFWSLAVLAVLLSSCGRSKSSNVAFIPVAPENAVLCEAHDRSYESLLALLDSFQAMSINALCVKHPGATDNTAFKTFVDSCHDYSISVLIHAPEFADGDTALVERYDIDGFHFVNISAANDDVWLKRLDALYTAKPMLILTDSMRSSLFDAGFGSFRSAALDNAMAAVLAGRAPVSAIDSALAYEKNVLPKNIRLVRSLSSLPDDATDLRVSHARNIMLVALGGVPMIDIESIFSEAAFFKMLFGLYAATPALQYGTHEVVPQASAVFCVMNSFQNERIMVAVNTGAAPAEYKWPGNVTRNAMELVAGEPLRSSGGQELPPYGYQIFRYKFTEGMQPLEMDDDF
jgi:hypothetical protein